VLPSAFGPHSVFHNLGFLPYITLSVWRQLLLRALRSKVVLV